MNTEPRSAPTRLLFLLLGLLALAPASAQEQELKFYDVEIIVFKNIKVPRGAELNLPSPAPTTTANTLDFSDAEGIEQATLQGFELLETDARQLTAEAEAIERSSRYSLLIHSAWRQPGLERAHSIPVRIKAGQLFSKNYSSIDQTTAVQPVANDDEVEVEVEEGFYELDGLVTISLARYLHTRADLVLRKPATAGGLNRAEAAQDDESEPVFGQRLINYVLNETRRMRSKKLHYLDHPQFGMLVLITPYEADPDSDEESEEASEDEPD